MLPAVHINEGSFMRLRRGFAGRGRTVGLFAAGALLITAGTAVAAEAVITGTYFGTNSEHGTVTFKVVAGGTAITGFKTDLGYNGKCGQGGGPGYNVSVSRIAIPASGKFAKKTTLKVLTFHAPGEVSGKASGDRVTGKVVQFLHGKPNKCYTETFTATAGQ
jgi:hypothetical protein